MNTCAHVIVTELQLMSSYVVWSAGFKAVLTGNVCCHYVSCLDAYVGEIRSNWGHAVVCVVGRILSFPGRQKKNRGK